MKTTKEIIQEFFKMKNGEYCDFESVESDLFEIAIMAILAKSKEEFSLYNLLEDIFILEKKLIASENKVRELESKICWITKEYEIKLKSKELEDARKSK